jgi:hypothetical protein
MSVERAYPIIVPGSSGEAPRRLRGNSEEAPGRLRPAVPTSDFSSVTIDTLYAIPCDSIQTHSFLHYIYFVWFQIFSYWTYNMQPTILNKWLHIPDRCYQPLYVSPLHFEGQLDEWYASNCMDRYFWFMNAQRIHMVWISHIRLQRNENCR